MVWKLLIPIAKPHRSLHEGLTSFIRPVLVRIREDSQVEGPEFIRRQVRYADGAEVRLSYIQLVP